MGAGVVKPQPGGGGFQIHINTRGGPMPRTPSQTQTGSVKCEECAVTFSAFKKRKPCKDCGRDFCSACTIQVRGQSPRQQQCLKCQTLLSGNFTRSQLSSWKVKDLKALLNNQNVNTAKCKEKNDLIDLVFSYYGGNSNLSRTGTEHERMVEQLAERMRQENQPEPQELQNRPSPCPGSQKPAQSQGTSASDNQMPQTSQTQENQAHDDAQRLREGREMEMGEAQRQRQRVLEEEERQEAPPVNPSLKLDDVKSEEEIDELSIKSLKRLLLNNFVDYKGCCERWELQERVKRLWRDNNANKRKAEEQRKLLEDPSLAQAPTTGEDELCRICMDATIDCVLLECGHMVTCTNCGKRLAECPICRQFVIRAVHTFRS